MATSHPQQRGLSPLAVLVDLPGEPLFRPKGGTSDGFCSDPGPHEGHEGRAGVQLPVLNRILTETSFNLKTQTEEKGPADATENEACR